MPLSRRRRHGRARGHHGIRITVARAADGVTLLVRCESAAHADAASAPGAATSRC